MYSNLDWNINLVRFHNIYIYILNKFDAYDRSYNRFADI